MKFKNYLIIFFVLLLGFLNLFASSGYANDVKYTSYMTWLSLPLFGWIAQKPQVYIHFTSSEKSVYAFFFVFMLFSIMIAYDSNAFQLTNLVATFGLPLWCLFFTNFSWEKLDFYKLGISCGVWGLILITLFLPGRLLSGWNSNSPIFAMPLVFFSLSCICCSDVKKVKRLISMAVIWATTVLLLEILHNRGSLVALILFATLLLVQSKLSMRLLRIIAVTIIALNVLIPYLHEFVEQMDLFDLMQDSLAAMIEHKKEGGFNGREELWEWSIKIINESPFWGAVGVRKLYPHNFSMDLLMCFGWVGWIAFAWMTLVVLFRTFRNKSRYNIFPLGFLCYILLNSFENVFACCNMFVIFSYMMPAVALRMNKIKNTPHRWKKYYL